MPAVWVATPVFDGAHWDEEDDAGRHPTIQQIFGELRTDSANGDVQIGTDGKAVSTTAGPASPTTTRSRSATSTS